MKPGQRPDATIRRQDDDRSLLLMLRQNPRLLERMLATADWETYERLRRLGLVK